MSNEFVEEYNVFLAGEISAVETYEMALKTAKADDVKKALIDCQKGVDNETDAIAVLEQSEAERLVQYEAQQSLVVSPVLEVLKSDLLPAQHETHLTMSSLLKSMVPAA